jgi:AraC-like DNA-binding protein
MPRSAISSKAAVSGHAIRRRDDLSRPPIMTEAPTACIRRLRCAVPGVVALSCASARRYPRHTHDQFGFGLIDVGAQRSLSGRGVVEAGPGDVITVNPGEVHDGAPIGAARRWRMLYLDPEVVADLLDRSVAPEFTAPVLAQPPAARLVDAVLRAATADRQDPLAWEGPLLVLLRRLCAMRPARSGGGAPAAVRRALALMDDDPAAPHSLADLAAVSGLSRFQILRAVARATGLTPHAYLMQRRVQRARRLIDGGMALAEAAAASGFADQSHMTRMFTRVFGLPPGAYAAAR